MGSRKPRGHLVPSLGTSLPVVCTAPTRPRRNVGGWGGQAGRVELPVDLVGLESKASLVLLPQASPVT